MTNLFGSKATIIPRQSKLPTKTLVNTTTNKIVSGTKTNTSTVNKDKKQTTMSNYLLDSFLVENLKKKERATKASTTKSKDKMSDDSSK